MRDQFANADELSEAELLERATQGVRAIPLHDYCGLEIVQIEPEAIIEMPLTENVGRLGGGGLHGGATGVLVDVAAGFAAAVDPNFDFATQDIVTVDVMIRYGRQPKTGPIRATAHRAKFGGKHIEVDTVVEDADGLIVARASALMLIRDNKA